MLRGWINHAVKHDFNQFAQPQPDERVLIQAKQRGVRLQQRQVRVRGLPFFEIGAARALL